MSGSSRPCPDGEVRHTAQVTLDCPICHPELHTGCDHPMPREPDRTPSSRMIELLDDLRNGVHALGWLDEGGAEQANAILKLREELFDKITEAAREVINPNRTGGAS